MVSHFPLLKAKFYMSLHSCFLDRTICMYISSTYLWILTNYQLDSLYHLNVLLIQCKRAPFQTLSNFRYYHLNQGSPNPQELGHRAGGERWAGKWVKLHLALPITSIATWTIPTIAYITTLTTAHSSFLWKKTVFHGLGPWCRKDWGAEIFTMW